MEILENSYIRIFFLSLFLYLVLFAFLFFIYKSDIGVLKKQIFCFLSCFLLACVFVVLYFRDVFPNYLLEGIKAGVIIFVFGVILNFAFIYLLEMETINNWGKIFPFLQFLVLPMVVGFLLEAKK